jgi:hypothetical protein
LVKTDGQHDVATKLGHEWPGRHGKCLGGWGGYSLSDNRN